jgi:hypothetical protein
MCTGPKIRETLRNGWRVPEQSNRFGDPIVVLEESWPVSEKGERTSQFPHQGVKQKVISDTDQFQHQDWNVALRMVLTNPNPVITFENSEETLRHPRRIYAMNSLDFIRTLQTAQGRQAERPRTSYLIWSSVHRRRPNPEQLCWASAEWFENLWRIHSFWLFCWTWAISSEPIVLFKSDAAQMKIEVLISRSRIHQCYKSHPSSGGHSE